MEIEERPPTGVHVAPESGRVRYLLTGGTITLIGAVVIGLTGWLRAKGLAVVLAPKGLGLYGQCWAFALYAGQIGGLGVGVAATKLVAQAREREDRQAINTVIGLALAIPLLVGTFIAVSAIALANPLGNVLLGQSNFLLIAFTAASVPLVAIQGVLQHILQGFEDAWGQTISYATYGVAFTLLSIAGALAWGVLGAVVGLLAGNLVLIVLYTIRHSQLLRLGIRETYAVVRAGLVHIFSSDAMPLIKIGVASLILGTVWSVADLSVRSVIRDSWGNATAGLWFALLLLSSQLLGTVVGALSYFTAPLVSRAGQRADHREIASLIDDSLRLALIIMLPLLTILILIRDPLVTVLFSSEFAPLASRVPAMLAGNFFYTISWTLGVALVPLGMTRHWLGIGVISSAVFAVVGNIAGMRYGLDGAVAAWDAIWLVSALATVVVLVRRKAWHPTPRSLFALLFGTVILASVAFIGAPYVIPLAASLLALFAMVVIKPHELQTAVALIRKFIKRSEH